MAADAAFRGPGPELVVGVDVATADVRVVCVDAGGGVLARGAAPLAPPQRAAGGRSEQDARSWWPATVAALRQALAALPDASAGIRAVSVAATSGTVVLADGRGVPTGPALLYDDRRGADLTAAARAAGAARFDALGLRETGLGAVGRIAWLVRDAGHGAGGAVPARVCHTGDLLGWRLAGHPVPTDWNSALKSGFDPLRLEWAHEALDAAGVDAGLLPEARAPGTAVATVCAAAARETGLPQGCVVRLGTTDGCAGQIACGATRPGQFVGVLGTTYVLKGVSAGLVPDPSGALYSHRAADGAWLPGGASNTGGQALARWPRDRLDALDAAAARHGPAAGVTYPLRRDGERYPFATPDARGFDLGPVGGDDVAAYRAALEGVAFLERLSLAAVARLGIPVTAPVATAGGGNRSEVWLRIRATVLDQPLRVASSAETALGAALLAAAGTLHAGLDAAVDAMVAPGRVVEPVPQERDDLARSYARFVGALDERGWLPAGLAAAAVP